MKYEKIIIDIASDYIYNNDLKNYLKDIKFINNSEQKVPYIAGYDSNNKIILFNYERAGNPKYKYNDIIYFIYHELTHVKQSKISHNIFNYPEKELFKYAFKLQKDSYFLYLLEYFKFVTEYNATLEGKINAMNYLNINNKNEIVKEITKYYNNFGESLLKEFYKDIDEIDKYNKIVKKCTYDDYKKILLGLPVESNTIEKIKKYDNDIITKISKNLI